MSEFAVDGAVSGAVVGDGTELVVFGAGSEEVAGGTGIVTGLVVVVDVAAVVETGAEVDVDAVVVLEVVGELAVVDGGTGIDVGTGSVVVCSVVVGGVGGTVVGGADEIDSDSTGSVVV